MDFMKFHPHFVLDHERAIHWLSFVRLPIEIVSLTTQFANRMTPTLLTLEQLMVWMNTSLALVVDKTSSLLSFLMDVAYALLSVTPVDIVGPFFVYWVDMLCQTKTYRVPPRELLSASYKLSQHPHLVVGRLMGLVR
jgi:hypothetical protein